ncbi:MAG: DotA/TraY family protein, partial [Desulfovibrio sp.]|nr:DotA/TraY family protein [Desulfovibrio sp.]
MESRQSYRHGALKRVFAACLLLTLAVTLTHVEAGAAASGLSSIPEVKVYDQDVSTSVFNKIFGANWQNFAGQSGGGGGTGPTLIFELLQTLNSVCAAAVSWLIIFTVLVGSVGAAHEGKSLAGKHSSPWVPIRFAFSFAAIAPVPVFKGLCAMQILILAGIGVSIDFANQMWSTGLEYVQQYGSITNESPPSAMLAGQKISAGALRTSAMLHYMIEEQKCDFSENGTTVSQAEWKEDNDKWSYQYAIPETCSSFGLRTNLKPGDMGGFTFTKTKLGTTKEDIAKGKEIDTVRKRALMTLANKLESTARKLGNKTYTHEDLPAVFQAAAAYSSAINSGLAAQAAARAGTRDRLDDFVNIAKDSGWIMAGSYYWIIVNENAKIINALTDSMTYYPPNMSALMNARVVREEWTTYMEPNIREITGALSYSSFGDIDPESGQTRGDMRSTAEAAAIHKTGGSLDRVTDSLGFIGEIPA